MIKNVPSANELRNASLRLYFNAWAQVASILVMIHESPLIAVKIRDRDIVPVTDVSRDITLDASKSALADLLRRSQSDLQLAYTLILQSQELGLKARICAKSPYLLLLGADVKSWAKPGADFMDFRTLDASDLIKVVNAITTPSLSPCFVTTFERLRRGRNKISHMGRHGDALEPLAVVDILVEQYAEMYVGRNWLVDRARAASISNVSHFFDKRYNELTAAIEALVEMDYFLTEKQRRKLLGLPPEGKLFSCPRCMHQSRTDYAYDNVRTAYLIADTNANADQTSTLSCRLCKQKYEIAAADVKCLECDFNVIFNDADYAGICCNCGYDPHEV